MNGQGIQIQPASSGSGNATSRRVPLWAAGVAVCAAAVAFAWLGYNAGRTDEANVRESEESIKNLAHYLASHPATVKPCAKDDPDCARIDWNKLSQAVEKMRLDMDKPIYVEGK